jgi:hypothetical protein
MGWSYWSFLWWYVLVVCFLETGKLSNSIVFLQPCTLLNMNRYNISRFNSLLFSNIVSWTFSGVEFLCLEQQQFFKSGKES